MSGFLELLELLQKRKVLDPVQVSVTMIYGDEGNVESLQLKRLK